MSGPRKDSLAVTLILIALVTLFLTAVAGYAKGVKLVPYVIGFPTLILLLVLLIGEFRPSFMKQLENALSSLWGANAEKIESDDPPPERESWLSVVRVVGWAAGFFALVYYFGFYTVPFFFIVLFLVTESRVGIIKAVASAAVAAAILYGGLGILNVDLWPGVIPEVIAGLLGGSIAPPL